MVLVTVTMHAPAALRSPVVCVRRRYRLLLHGKYLIIGIVPTIVVIDNVVATYFSVATGERGDLDIHEEAADRLQDETDDCQVEGVTQGPDIHRGGVVRLEPLGAEYCYRHHQHHDWNRETQHQGGLQ